MVVDRILSDPLDKLVFVSPEVETEFLDTMKFAMEHPYRMRSFIDAVHWLLGWGRGSAGENPTSITIGKDFTPRSFTWHIATHRFDVDSNAIVQSGGISILMYYREEDQQWETHS